MNKLQGFKTLRELGIPAAPWKFMTADTELSKGLLWTVRTAVEVGDDYNLPRAVGVTAEVAKQKYLEFSKQGLKVIYYPYFKALTSGVIDISEKHIVIEGVYGDLWKLVTEDRPDFRIMYARGYFYNCNVPTDGFIRLLGYAKQVFAKMKGFIEMDKHIYLEWSFAQNVNYLNLPDDEHYLVFYECRVIN